MGQEIERKFRVKGDGWRTATGVPFRQGYLCAEKHRTVRVRTEGTRAVTPGKGGARGLTCSEFEYEIPKVDADEMLDTLCGRPLIEKIRHTIEHGGMTWEIDEFSGENQGLVIAEIELEDEGQDFAPPDWLGEEVSGDPRFYNANLAREPYMQWRADG